MPHATGSARAGLFTCAGVVGLRPGLRAGPASATPLRALYDEDGTRASWLARSLAGHRITCTGLLGRAPNGVRGWMALGEATLVPCPACGGDHHWPVGVLAVQALDAEHLAHPFAPVTLQGVLDVAEGAGGAAGLPDRLVLRAARPLPC